MASGKSTAVEELAKRLGTTFAVAGAHLGIAPEVMDHSSLRNNRAADAPHTSWSPQRPRPPGTLARDGARGSGDCPGRDRFLTARASAGSRRTGASC